ncbi:MAG: DinB family protein [Gemmatimonadetes bacterium]|nr:DinB family protein [Gemmatimonadota bacterium]
MNPIVISLNNSKAYFDRGTDCFAEADSEFAPQPGLYTVAQHVAHTAQTVDWFVEGVFGGKGFDMDFAKHDAAIRQVKSLAEARAWWERSMKRAVDTWGAASNEDLAKPIENDNLMGGAPKGAAAQGLVDHTAHHRGALAVYARLVGKTPSMPYM